MLTLAKYNVNLFGIKMEFDPVAFTIPIGQGWDIYWYGICIALGFLLAVIYGFWRAKKFDVDPDRLTDVVLVTTPLAILCARLYYIIFYKGDLEIKSVADFIGFSGKSGVAGLAIYGGVIGAFVFGLLMCKLRKVKFLDALDLAASGFLIGQAVGRWGNFFNQEAFGSATDSAWGMSSQATGNTLVHPCFLYESIWCILGFIILHFIGNRRKFSGQLGLSYGVWYGFGRAFIEHLRTDSLYWGPLRVSQWLSGALVILCGSLLIYMFIKLKTAKKDETYVAMFDEIDTSSVEVTHYYDGDEESDDKKEAETEENDDTSDDVTEDKTTKEEKEDNNG